MQMDSRTHSRTNDHVGTLALVERSRSALGQVAIVIGPDGKSWTGPHVDETLIAQTRAGKMPVVVQRLGDAIQNVALAPIVRDGKWIGAAGLLSPVDAATAGVLSGLTRSDVVILSSGDAMVAATTLDSTDTRDLLKVLREKSLVSAPSGEAVEVLAGTQRRLVVTAALGDASLVVFTRALSSELAVLPELRRVAFISALGAFALALLLGVLLSARVARPVRQLAIAAQGVTDGEFNAALPTTRIREVQRVAETFKAMRTALAERLAELRSANEALVDRNARLSALQADLMQRDRLTATGRLVSQLAHEIRNPVANLRNCLELIRRRVADDAEAREFTDLAIDELLRMHELAEQMLDLNRPRDSETQRCNPASVAREVATLSSLGHAQDAVVVSSMLADDVHATLAPDALKQVLLNLVQNAREAMQQCENGTTDAPQTIEISVHNTPDEIFMEVRDRGPGIPPASLARIFDPFFTTKAAMHGVGLGLFVAEGVVRTAGGRLSAGNRDDGGAWFRVQLPIAAAIVEVMQSSAPLQLT